MGVGEWGAIGFFLLKANLSEFTDKLIKI
jgi:hypothetical protein